MDLKTPSIESNPFLLIILSLNLHHQRVQGGATGNIAVLQLQGSWLDPGLDLGLVSLGATELLMFSLRLRVFPPGSPIDSFCPETCR